MVRGGVRRRHVRVRRRVRRRRCAPRSHAPGRRRRAAAATSASASAPRWRRHAAARLWRLRRRPHSLGEDGGGIVRCHGDSNRRRRAQRPQRSGQEAEQQWQRCLRLQLVQRGGGRRAEQHAHRRRQLVPPPPAVPAAHCTLACVRKHVLHRVHRRLWPLGDVAQRCRPRLLTREAGLRDRLLEYVLGRVLQPQPDVGFRQPAKPHVKTLATTIAAAGSPAG